MIYNNKFTGHWFGRNKFGNYFSFSGREPFESKKKMQECSMYFCRTPFFFFFCFVLTSPRFFFFFLFNDRVLFELGGPNSTGNTILTVLVWGTCDVNIVLPKFHWTIRYCIKSPAQEFYSLLYFIKTKYVIII